MDSANVFNALSRLGLSLAELSDGRLHVSPRDRITAEARALIVEHRDGLLRLVHDGRTVTASADPGDLIAAYHERLAICLEAGEISEAEAHRIATEECGADLEKLAYRQVTAWRARLEALPIPLDFRIAKLRRDLIEATRERWVQQAAALGWDDLSMFGAHPVTPCLRAECWGLATGLVLSPHNGRVRSGEMRKTRLVEIDRTRAVFETPAGARPVVCRFARGLEEAVCVWDVAEAGRGAAGEDPPFSREFEAERMQPPSGPSRPRTYAGGRGPLYF